MSLYLFHSHEAIHVYFFFLKFSHSLNMLLTIYRDRIKNRNGRKKERKKEKKYERLHCISISPFYRYISLLCCMFVNKLKIIQKKKNLLIHYSSAI